MTPRRVLRSGVALATIVASVLLLGASATPPPVPDDPADPTRAAEYWLDGARIREAWQTTRGDGVTIAVIDTGIGKVPGVFDEAVVGGTDVSGSSSRRCSSAIVPSASSRDAEAAAAGCVR